MGLSNPIKAKLKFLLTIILLIVVFWLLKESTSPTEQVLLTITVDQETDAATVEQLADSITEHDASATFFLTGDWAAEHEDETIAIAEQHEIGCRGQTGEALPKVGDLEAEIAGCKETIEGITGQDVQGFRGSDINGDAYAVVAEHYVYDSSTYRHYEWFWEQPPTGLVPVPTSSFFFLPLDDRVGLGVLPLGDFYFYLIRKTRTPTLVLTFTPKEMGEQMLDFEYLLDYYRTEGIPVTSIGAMIGGE